LICQSVARQIINLILKFTGNTFTYATYALVRCNAIISNCNKFPIEWSDLAIDPAELVESDYNILRKIPHFAYTIDEVITTQLPHYLCKHLYSFVDCFHSNYEATRCINYNPDGSISSINKSKILLYKMVRHVITICFMLLGVPCVDRI